jgi:hypothetical protein
VEAGAREAFLGDLALGLATAATAAQLRTAATPPPSAGIAYAEQPQQTWDADGRLVPVDAPGIVLGLDPPADARSLASLWGIGRPVAVSGDVHQQSWWLMVGGDPIPDEYGPRIAASDLRAGRWRLRARLSARPEGPLPGVAAGASPAYDVTERGVVVVELEIVLARA